jgi:hypothetical protein
MKPRPITRIEKAILAVQAKYEISYDQAEFIICMIMKGYPVPVIAKLIETARRANGIRK